MNQSKHLDFKFIREPNYLQLQEKCLEEKHSKSCSLLPNHKLLVQKKKFNDSLLPKHVDEKTIFGIETKSNCNIADVIFPNRLFGEKFVEEESKTESYKNFHHAYEIGQQLNRRYSSTFDPHYRYGKTLKLLPSGVWFKNNINYESSNENTNDITEYISKLLESEENKKCHGRYPFIDNRQGKFMGRSYVRAVDILNRNYPDKKEYEFFDYLSAVNKIKYAAKKQKCNLRELRETYNLLDKELTGWLPLEQVYAICYRFKLKPEKQLFDLALNSIRAVNENSVRYDLFVDLLDPNVKFAPVLEKDTKTEQNRFVATYQNDYENRFSQSVQLNKKDDSLLSYACYVKPAIDDLDCLGFETTARTLLNPSIFTNYGITHRDFYIGRNKKVMKKLFYDVGMNLSDDIFNVVWDNVYQREGFEAKVSVETFRRVLQELISTK